MLSQGPLPMGEVSGVTLGMLAPLDSFFSLASYKDWDVGPETGV